MAEGLALELIRLLCTSSRSSIKQGRNRTRFTDFPSLERQEGFLVDKI